MKSNYSIFGKINALSKLTIKDAGYIAICPSWCFHCFVGIQCELKIGYPNLITNLWKTKRRITKLIFGNDSTIIPLSYDTLVMHIG